MIFKKMDFFGFDIKHTKVIKHYSVMIVLVEYVCIVYM